MNKNVSIIVPVRNEERYIVECIDSIINFDYEKEYLELIFVDGMSEDKTVEIIKEYIKKYPYIKILSNKDKIVPISMNMAIKEASGEYICRLDAHAKYPKNYISKLLEWSEKLNADNVGAACITDIKSQTNIAKSIKFVMSDKFGIGNSLFRLGVDEPVEVDTVPFGFYKKSVFKNIGLYDHRLVRTQDLELNKRLKNNGGKIFLVPDVKCTYYPRENYKSFFKNRFETGKWVILSSYFTNTLKSISLRHLVPLIFTFSIFLTAVLGLFEQKILYVLGFILVTYTSILFFRSYFIKRNIVLSIYIVLAYLTLHFSYGLGSLVGIYKVLKGANK